MRVDSGSQCSCHGSAGHGYRRDHHPYLAPWVEERRFDGLNEPKIVHPLNLSEDFRGFKLLTKKTMIRLEPKMKLRLVNSRRIILGWPWNCGAPSMGVNEIRSCQLAFRKDHQHRITTHISGSMLTAYVMLRRTSV